MFRLLALIISIGLQIVAASIALRFMKLTKYRLSWILLSLAFTFMAIRKIIHLIELTRGEESMDVAVLDEWLGAFISVMIFGGVILIRELFLSLKRAEIDRIRSERKVLHAIINTEENERKRFAKDLHDDLGPLLSTVKMSITALAARADDPVDKDIIANTSHVVNEAIATIKDISNTLSPHVLSNFGLESATSTFIKKINRAGDIKFTFNSNLGNKRLHSDIEAVVYRSICELINNSFKHSGASAISVDLNIHGNFIILQYNDNGSGFDTTILDSEENMGMGLSNIQTRVRSVNGIFVLESKMGEGMQSLIKINIREEKGQL
ncbi:MAG: sensor histidine kinase [Bacteroidales bacterium]|nr:sensor histidine kinase [Bacteroidales bacterium]